MENIPEDIVFKLNEAKFHIELLEVIEKIGTTLTHQKSTDEEASYIFSAILNAFFSITELSGGWKNPEVKRFKESHPIIYERANKGGLRNTTVHVAHVKIDYVGYIPTTNFNLRKTPKLIIEKETQKQDKNSVNFSFTPKFYIDINGDLINIIDFCTNHLYEIEKFLKR